MTIFNPNSSDCTGTTDMDGCYGTSTVKFDHPGEIVTYICCGFAGERPEKLVDWFNSKLLLTVLLGGIVGWCYSRYLGEWSLGFKYWAVKDDFVHIVDGANRVINHKPKRKKHHCFWSGFV
jgi:hypothetical protein